MKLPIPLALPLLLVSFASASAKDDITKELMKSNGKTRVYYLYVPSTVKATSAADHHASRIESNRRHARGKMERLREEGRRSFSPDQILRIWPCWASPQDGPDFLHELVEETQSQVSDQSRDACICLVTPQVHRLRCTCR